MVLLRHIVWIIYWSQAYRVISKFCLPRRNNDESQMDSAWKAANVTRSRHPYYGEHFHVQTVVQNIMHPFTRSVDRFDDLMHPQTCITQHQIFDFSDNFVSSGFNRTSKSFSNSCWSLRKSWNYSHSPKYLSSSSLVSLGNLPFTKLWLINVTNFLSFIFGKPLN